MIHSNIPQMQRIKLLKQSEEEVGKEGYVWNRNRPEINRRAKTVRKWERVEMPA
jgi:hypothetical protein